MYVLFTHSPASYNAWHIPGSDSAIFSLIDTISFVKVHSVLLDTLVITSVNVAVIGVITFCIFLITQDVDVDDFISK
jgi:hypothetical protein